MVEINGSKGTFNNSVNNFQHNPIDTGKSCNINNSQKSYKNPGDHRKECALYNVAHLIAKKWTLLILIELYRGGDKKRFNELKNSLKNITPKILSNRLKELEEQGLIENKIIASSIPVISEYYLTTKGKELIDIIKTLKIWSIKHTESVRDCKNFDCKACSFT